MKTLDLIAGICFGLICILAIIVAIVQKRIDLLAFAFITGTIANVALREYWKLKRKGS
jgi:branched-subunit amino acid permease